RCAHDEVCEPGLQCIRGTCSCGRGRDFSDGYCRPSNPDIRLRSGGGLQFSSSPQKDRPLAQECPENPEACRLPDCFCSKTGKVPPGNLRVDEVPQFVVLTFDDAVNARTMADYKKLFGSVRYRNPNGCPIKATFFVSHEWTNYDLVQWLSEEGHEIASNSITHTSLQNKGRTKWLNEMDGQRRILAMFGNVPEEEIVGMRSPLMTLGGEEQFEMMQRARFLYDNSISADPDLHEAPYWPQTLDYRLAWRCNQGDCPNGTFPGLWEVPLNLFQGDYDRQEDSFKKAAM
uniref:NodB homology domain-containing protein n=1 Tax=Steinernema glaseri TaxID=37863 RepID=A0A1I8AH24_9BILA